MGCSQKLFLTHAGLLDVEPRLAVATRYGKVLLMRSGMVATTINLDVSNLPCIQVHALLLLLFWSGSYHFVSSFSVSSVNLVLSVLPHSVILWNALLLSVAAAMGMHAINSLYLRSS